MSELKNSKPSSLSPIAWAGALCIACCTIPFIGIAVGSATLAAFAIYSEEAAIAIAVLGATLLAYKFYSRRKSPSCDLNGNCRPAPDKGGEPKPD